MGIPKIVHYCWFGGSIPRVIRECMDSWRILEDAGYEFVRWDESNCSFEENEFVKKAFMEQRWAFVSDYYRMKALYEQGGLYLDADVEVRRNPSSLLDNSKFVCGYIVDCCVSTSVLGSEPGHFIPEMMLDWYDRTVFVEKDLETELVFRSDEILSRGFITNNYYLTRLMLDNYPDFKLNGESDEFAPGCFIYDKSLFTTGSLLDREYFFDLSYGSWREEGGRPHKEHLGHMPFFDFARKVVRNVRAQNISNHVFYSEYKERKLSGRNQ